MIKRQLSDILNNRIGKGKALIIFGARQTGKTTLLSNLLKKRERVLWLNGDDPDVSTLFQNASSTKLRSFINTNKIIVIDEAQRIEDIGLKLKLITE